MSVFAITLPNTAAVANVARPLLGLGLFAGLLMVFRPLVSGMLRAALLVLKPRQSLAQRKAERNLRDVMMLNTMANELDRVEPSLAAELRWLAARGE